MTGATAREKTTAAKPATSRKTSTTAKPPATPEPTPVETAKENPRTTRSREKFEQACELIKGELVGRDWVSSIAIHRKFNGKIAEGMYGRVKSALAIEHRRVKADSGPATYEWRLPKS
jgi:hypothetical protein